jgi:hypothetical protein
MEWDGRERRRGTDGHDAILAAHGAHIGQLREDVSELKQELKKANETLAAINITLAEAKGGWTVAVGLGGLAATAGASLTAAVAWAWQNLRG